MDIVIEGLGGMTRFSNRLKEVDLAMREAQGTPILQKRKLQLSDAPANVPAAKVRMAQKLMIQLDQQKNHSTSPNLFPADVHYVKK
jgi:hypothetical protein